MYAKYYCSVHFTPILHKHQAVLLCMNNIPDGAMFNEDIIALNDFTGTSVVQVTATDADDPTYGNSARVVYSILQGQPYFSVEPKTGKICYAFSVLHS